MSAEGLQRFFEVLDSAAKGGTWIKLTLGKYRGSEPGLTNIFVRPVALKAGPRLSFLFRYASRDETQNHGIAEALDLIRSWVPSQFRDAHLFTPAQTFHFTGDDSGEGRLRTVTAKEAPRSADESHDRAKAHAVPLNAPWLQDLGVTSPPGVLKAGMAAKFKQINRFVELMQPLVDEARAGRDEPIRIVDMGCGKGYLTFAAAVTLGVAAEVVGVERRPDLVTACNDVARRRGVTNLRFEAGEIGEVPLGACDMLIALHACDTATDDALATGIARRARVLVVSPCCQKEVRPQIVPPDVLAPVLMHGILLERQAEFVTDALRALLLEWAGYRTRVIEFISTEHTARNLMITAVRGLPEKSGKAENAARAFAQFYGVKRQRLAEKLGFDL